MLSIFSNQPPLQNVIASFDALHPYRRPGQEQDQLPAICTSGKASPWEHSMATHTAHLHSLI